MPAPTQYTVHNTRTLRRARCAVRHWILRTACSRARRRCDAVVAPVGRAASCWRQTQLDEQTSHCCVVNVFLRWHCCSLVTLPGRAPRSNAHRLNVRRSVDSTTRDGRRIQVLDRCFGDSVALDQARQRACQPNDLLPLVASYGILHKDAVCGFNDWQQRQQLQRHCLG